MPGTPLSLRERNDIAEMLRDDPEVSWAHMAREIGCSPATVAREVNRNSGREQYRPASADRAAHAARREGH
jgi:IS30 family transposase